MDPQPWRVGPGVTPASLAGRRAPPDRRFDGSTGGSQVDQGVWPVADGRCVRRCGGLRGALRPCPKQGEFRKLPRQILEAKVNAGILRHDLTEPQNGKGHLRRPLHAYHAALERRLTGLIVLPFLGRDRRDARVGVGRRPIGMSRRRAYCSYSTTRQVIQERAVKAAGLTGGWQAVDDGADRHPVRQQDIHLLGQYRSSSESTVGAAGGMWTGSQYRFSAILPRLDGVRTSSDPSRASAAHDEHWLEQWFPKIIAASPAGGSACCTAGCTRRGKPVTLAAAKISRLGCRSSKGATTSRVSSRLPLWRALPPPGYVGDTRQR